MKLLLLLAVGMLGVWLWRTGRATPGWSARNTRQPSSSDVNRMVACRYCELHLPEAESVNGSLGAYCSQAHKRQLEG